MSDLMRFIKAQESASGGFEVALAEMRAGSKEGHWIWYIFPQLAGLGSSAFSRAYAVSVAEAGEYLRHDVLRGRYLLICEAVVEKLKAGVNVVDLMGWDVDAMKLVSSLTLFHETAKRLCMGAPTPELRRLVLLTEEAKSYAARDGFEECSYTMAQFR
jgi:uncharacterized protein (DUF1810 family)